MTKGFPPWLGVEDVVMTFLYGALMLSGPKSEVDQVGSLTNISASSQAMLSSNRGKCRRL